MQKWEYLLIQTDGQSYAKAKVTWINGENAEAKEQKPIFQSLAELGQQGWEVVSMQESLFFFKRRIE